MYVHALCTDDSGGRDKVADAISATMQIRSASGVLICHKHQPTKSRTPCGHIIFCHDTIRRILFVVVSADISAIIRRLRSCKNIHRCKALGGNRMT